MAGIAGAALAGKPAKASAKPEKEAKEFVGVLCDTTKCIGCRACEVACGEANGMLVPDVVNDNALEQERKTSDKQWTVVNKYDTDNGEVYVKKQCFHCWQPACASACLTNAMDKTKEGPVIWHKGRCMGCRFCMVSCPFYIPKFEYDKAIPKVQKCIMCYERIQDGGQPACVQACPAGALKFGQKRELLETAKMRIYNSPKKYNHHIYGEFEAGGTSWLYLASVPFEQLGFDMSLGTEPYPEYSKGFLYSVPIVLLLWPSFLLGLNYMTRRKENELEGGDE